MTKSDVKILISDKKDHNDLSFSRLVDFSGITHELCNYRSYLADVKESTGAVNNVLALSCETLYEIQQDHGLYGNFKLLMRGKPVFIFVYGVFPSPNIDNALNSISDGAIKSVTTLPDNKCEYVVSKEFEDVSRQFTGLSFGPVSSENDFPLELIDKTGNVDSFVTIDKNPMFLRLKNSDCRIFINAARNLTDIQDTTTEEIKAERIFSGLIPALMFLKYVFKDHCWHSEKARGCFIIDDPLLKKKYGFLDYERLLEAMEKCNFHTSIAFIPWNYKRSKKNTVRLFKDNAHRFSLCIHGCDHTANEFVEDDTNKLDFKVKQATQRMIKHRDISGLDFNEVMIFPQEAFSSNSLNVLKSNNYLAAVNGNIIYNCNNKDFSYESLLQPAFMESGNFPVFYRRTPISVADFALDAFLGKPVILFEHHDFLGKENNELTEFIVNLNKICGSIEWDSLENIISNAYLQMKYDDSKNRLKFYTNRILIKNDTDKTQTYELEKPETGNFPIERVTVNGSNTGYTLSDDILKMTVDIEPGSTAEVSIRYQGPVSSYSKPFGRTYTVKVYARRQLSEFRDNVLVKNKILYSLGQKIIGIYHRWT